MLARGQLYEELRSTSKFIFSITCPLNKSVILVNLHYARPCDFLFRTYTCASFEPSMSAAPTPNLSIVRDELGWTSAASTVGCHDRRI